MTEPLTILGMKAGTAASMGAGSFVAALMMPGPWHLRLVTGACGCAAAFVFTPILSPLAVAMWAQIYGWLGVASTELPRDAVAGFVGFACGLTGIDICRWIIERGKFTLSKLRFPPWGRKTSKGD